MGTRLLGSLALGPSVTVPLFAFASAVQAQTQVAVEPYLGAYWFDDDALDFDFQGAEFDSGPILGARVLFPIRERWSLGAGYGHASITVSFRFSTILEPEGVVVEDDASEHLYYGTVEYAPLLPDPVGVHLLGELGGATYSPEGARSMSDLLAGFGAGLDVRASERATIRFEARDHLRFCSQVTFALPYARDRGLQASQEVEIGCDEDQVLHNLELSAGVRIHL
ncbi:MAG: hypothetical protein ACREMK_11090 [Gemmatimonadota bacterium]